MNMSGLDFLVLVLQISNSFHLNAFSFFLQFISSWFQVPSSIVAVKGRVFHGIVWSRLEVYIILSEIFKLFIRESHFRKAIYFFVVFVCNDGALNLHLHVVAQLLSVTM